MQRRTIIVAGKGGHQTQAKRLIFLLRNAGWRVDYVFEDSAVLATISDRSKDHSMFSWKILLPVLISIPFCLAFMLRICFKARNSNFVFFGPLNNVPLMLVCKIFGRDCIFIESWSRFDEFSKTYKLARLLGFKLCVQNEGLLVDGQNYYLGRLG